MYQSRILKAVPTKLRNYTAGYIKEGKHFLANLDNRVTASVANQARCINTEPTGSNFPFENLVMEGGGAKGMAFVGVIQYLEFHGIMKNFRRFGGSSIGALTAAAVALGYTSCELMPIWENDVKNKMMDNWFGWASFLPNIIKYYGWNHGDLIFEYIGTLIAAKSPSSDPDMSFEDLYRYNGVELCIVVNNVNRMCAEYCHPKTTPNMPIRVALRMSMGIPGLMVPILYNGDLYVDGGMLCNYPVHCFDGWYLSMNQKDMFFERIPEILDKNVRLSDEYFIGTNPKTLGCLVYADAEHDILRYDLDKRPGVLEPRKPSDDTKLFKAYIASMQTLRPNEKKSDRFGDECLHAFLTALHKNNKGDLRTISLLDLNNVFDDIDIFKEKYREFLFTNKSPGQVFELLDTDSNGKIHFQELCNYFEERDVIVHSRMDGCARLGIKNVYDYFWALKENLLKNAGIRYISRLDVQRTVGINTGYIKTQDFTVEPADADFLQQRGYHSIAAFMKTLK